MSPFQIYVPFNHNFPDNSHTLVQQSLTSYPVWTLFFQSSQGKRECNVQPKTIKDLHITFSRWKTSFVVINSSCETWNPCASSPNSSLSLVGYEFRHSTQEDAFVFFDLHCLCAVNHHRKLSDHCSVQTQQQAANVDQLFLHEPCSVGSFGGSDLHTILDVHSAVRFE